MMLAVNALGKYAERDIDIIMGHITRWGELICLCSPGNPTGTLISLKSLRVCSLLDYESFRGIVVVDEAYIDFVGEDASALSSVADQRLQVIFPCSRASAVHYSRLRLLLAFSKNRHVDTNGELDTPREQNKFSSRHTWTAVSSSNGGSSLRLVARGYKGYIFYPATDFGPSAWKIRSTSYKRVERCGVTRFCE
ncbi:hypothetical protein F5J12DRAFT_314123 [Pisolithus orientalis]|uniref:uncharacterized protein n=1 Tax=Pisolithus orientalis TaxID=936130 RepID=UPI002224EE64|nr:uncharacterized protein F5J12DRAFT_314123 [Pisolithus orientalis]KAI6030893.1 hypothetical protein F5J12DRAFT_314123 [Pisolithus orientalis]